MLNNHIINLVSNPFTGHEEAHNDLMKEKSRDKWTQTCTRELVHCTNFIKNESTGRNYFHFMHCNEVPNGVAPDHGKQHCTMRPKKEENRRNRFAVGINKVHFHGPVISPVTEQSLAKINMNSTISTSSEKFATLDIKNVFLITRFRSKMSILI